MEAHKGSTNWINSDRTFLKMKKKIKKQDTMNVTVHHQIRQLLTGVEGAGPGDKTAFSEH